MIQRTFASYLQQLQAKNYVYGTLWLPHDARARSLGTGVSVEEIARNAGWRVRIVPQLSVADGINAVRTRFPNMWFDRNLCADGLQALRRYRYEVDPTPGQFSKQPAHDDASHGSDALRSVVAMNEPRRAGYQTPRPPPRLTHAPGSPSGFGWMRG